MLEIQFQLVKEKRMNKILFLVQNINLIPKLKEKKVDIFVFPLSFFCVGIPKTFTINQITEDNAYIFVNRILNSKDANKLNKLLHKLPNNIKGIIFDDIGVIKMLEDVKIHKILYNTHFTTNFESINHLFSYVDDIIISTDITEKQIDKIILKANKKISLFTFGLVPAMYSRRLLLTNDSLHYNKKYENPLMLQNGKKTFLAFENEYGTYLYHYPYYNGLRLLNKKCHFNFFYTPFMKDNDILDLLDQKLTNIKWDYGFLDTKTIYKLKDIKKEAK